ncbi:MAG: hypothetical protein DI551_00620 [Micavibrio aeruginosavorus]|uniref:Uncharacterized protein n=1 Tax=Micavibrio aeruginosavorus TaxID=349221 RepID=A0A2W5PVP1_9BACT|nr:MAG: hypothetical protein DI551_00620 [Micavibrio aeruginosavorus]
MGSLLPKDENNNAIPVMGYKPNGAQKLTLTGASLRNPQPITSPVISVYATAAMTMEFGGDDVTADGNKHFVPANTLLDIDTDGKQYVAFYGTGTVYISERS